jgi:protein-S-isoprenylcysteine O-methyltransferase Ste14
MKPITNFKDKTLKQIRLWSWAAAVLPITALAGIFFVWAFGTSSWWSWAMITGETVMFAIAAVWWWWAMYTMRQLVKHWDNTRNNVTEVLKDVVEIKNIVKDVISAERDK